MQVGQPFQCIVNLQVTVAAQYCGLVVLVGSSGNWVVCTVGVESRTIHVRVIAVPELVAIYATLHLSIIINRCRWVHSDGSCHCTAVGELVLYPVALDVGLNLESVIEELRSKIEAHGGTIHARVHQNTIVIGVAGRHAIRQTAGSSTHAQVIVVRDGGTQHFVLPVGVECAILLGVGLNILDGVAVSAKLLCQNFCQCLCRQRLVGLAGSVDIHIGGEVHLRLALHTTLGGDDDDTIRSARTVNGCSGSILEDGHVLNVVRSNHRERVAHTLYTGVVQWHTVDDDKRVVVGAE